MQIYHLFMWKCDFYHTQNYMLSANPEKWFDGIMNERFSEWLIDLNVATCQWSI